MIPKEVHVAIGRWRARYRPCRDTSGGAGRGRAVWWQVFIKATRLIYMFLCYPVPVFRDTSDGKTMVAHAGWSERNESQQMYYAGYVDLVK